MWADGRVGTVVHRRHTICLVRWDRGGESLVYMRHLVRVAAVVVLLALLTGCTSTLTSYLQWSPVTAYDAPELQEMIGDGRPVEVFAEDPAPFHGWLLTDGDWDRIRDEVDRLHREIARLQAQIADDRTYASEVDRQKVAALEECRRAQWRAFAAGVGVGAGACAGIDRALDEISP